MATSTQNLKVVIDAVDNSSKAFDSVGKSISGIEKSLTGFKSNIENLQPAFKKMATVGGVAFAGLSAGLFSLAKSAGDAQRVTVTFDSMAKSINAVPTEALNGLREATRGLVDDTNLMKAGNKFMAMGLATSQDEMTKLSQMAVKLGSAMGTDATVAMEDFALMLANQSIPRLDTFGISSGKVRARIEELMTANEGMTRETAFMTAVMEQGEVSMAKLGDTALTAGERYQQMQAKMSNMKNELGDALLPVFERLVSAITPIIEKITQWADENPKLFANIALVVTSIAGLVAVIGTLGVVLVPIMTALTFLASPLGIIIMLIGVIVGLVIWWVANWQENMETIKWALQGVADFFVGIWESIKAFLLGIWESIKQAFMAWVNFHVAIWTGMFEGVKALFNGFMSFMGAIWTKLSEGFNGVVEGIKSMFKNGFDWIQKNVIDPIIGTIEKIKDAVNKIIGKAQEIGKDVGAKLGNIFSFGKRASGGLVSAGRPYIVGERQPEMFIPSSAGRIVPSVGGNGSIVVNISGNSFMGEDDMVERVGDKLVQILKRTQRI